MDKDGITDDKWRGNWSNDAKEGDAMLQKRIKTELRLLEDEELPRTKHDELTHKPFTFDG